MLGDAGSVNTRNWVKGLEEAGAEVVCWSLPRRNQLFKLIFFLWDLWKLKLWLVKHKPDILIGYRTTSYGFFGALMNYHPLVIAAQAIDDVSSQSWWINLLSRLSVRYAIYRADLIHAWAINMAPALEQRGSTREKILIMARGVDLKKFLFRQRSFECNQLRLIVTRSLYPEYHVDTIISAVAHLVHNKQVPDIILTIAGSGPLEAELRTLCSQKGINDKVIFTGRVPNGEIAGLLNENDYYISMPDTEGASASLFEAFASGLFPIVTDLPANRVWLKNQQNGLLVAEINADVLAKQILYAWQHPAFCRKAAELNRLTAENSLSLENNMKFFLACYHDLLTHGKVLPTKQTYHLKQDKF